MTASCILHKQGKPYPRTCPECKFGPCKYERNEVNEHELKITKDNFDAIVKGQKTFELRRNDRNYEVGDILLLRDWDDNLKEFSGLSYRVRVMYILKDVPELGLHPDYIIMGIRR